jgi:archaellum component FlaC
MELMGNMQLELERITTLHRTIDELKDENHALYKQIESITEELNHLKEDKEHLINANLDLLNLIDELKSNLERIRELTNY